MEDTTKQINAIFDKYQEALNSGIQTCNLGSCQYKTIEDTYDWALALIKIMGRPAFEKSLGITYAKELSKDEFLDILWEILNIDGGTCDDDNNDITIAKACNLSRETLTIELYYQSLQECSSDLWSAAKSPLHDLKIENPVETPPYGPILNQLAQSENFIIGIMLAYTTFLYGTHLEAFAGFDT